MSKRKNSDPSDPSNNNVIVSRSCTPNPPSIFQNSYSIGSDQPPPPILLPNTIQVGNGNGNGNGIGNGIGNGNGGSDSFHGKNQQLNSNTGLYYNAGNMESNAAIHDNGYGGGGGNNLSGHHGHPNLINQKRRRVTRACDECRKKKVKCDGQQPCIHCTVYSYECTYNQPSSRRKTTAVNSSQTGIAQSATGGLHSAASALHSGTCNSNNTTDSNNANNANNNSNNNNNNNSNSNSNNSNGVATSTGAGAGAGGTSTGNTNEPSPSTPVLQQDPQEVLNQLTRKLNNYQHFVEKLLPDLKVNRQNQEINVIKLTNVLSQVKNEKKDEDISLKYITDTYNLANKKNNINNGIPYTHSPSSAPTAPPSNQPTPQAAIDGSIESHMGKEIKIILPPKDIALKLISNTWDNACVLFRFYHRPSFIKDLNVLYETDPANYSNQQQRFLPLVYSVMACGSLFYKSAQDTKNNVRNNNNNNDEKSDRDLLDDEGYKYFIAARKLIDITDTRDIYGIQTIVMLILFLQCGARLSTCYSYIGIALRAALREGLHRKLDYPFNPIELEIRKRIFWTIYKMDIYVNAMLGLPRTISEEDFDQDLPSELDDENITETGYIYDNQKGRLSSAGIANAHTKLIFVMKKIVKKLYPIKPSENFVHLSANNVVYELELDLQNWVNELPLELKPGIEPEPQYFKANRLLHIAYLHVKIILYRPFIHYISADYLQQFTNSNNSDDLKSIEKAKNCINVARIVVKLAQDMINKHMLSGSYWFSIYTIFFSVACLVFYVHSSPQLNSKGEIDQEYIAIKQDAEMGKRLLNLLKDSSMAARRTYNILNSLFEQLNRRTANFHPATPTNSNNGNKTNIVNSSNNSGNKNGINGDTLQINSTVRSRPFDSNAQGEIQFEGTQQMNYQNPDGVKLENNSNANLQALDNAIGSSTVNTPRLPLNITGKKSENSSINNIVNGVNYIDGINTGISLNISAPTPNQEYVNSPFGYSPQQQQHHQQQQQNQDPQQQQQQQQYQPAQGQQPKRESSLPISKRRYVPGMMDQLDTKIFGRFLPPYMNPNNTGSNNFSHSSSPGLSSNSSYGANMNTSNRNKNNSPLSNVTPSEEAHNNNNIATGNMVNNSNVSLQPSPTSSLYHIPSGLSSTNLNTMNNSVNIASGNNAQQAQESGSADQQQQPQQNQYGISSTSIQQPIPDDNVNSIFEDLLTEWANRSPPGNNNESTSNKNSDEDDFNFSD